MVDGLKNKNKNNRISFSFFRYWSGSRHVLSFEFFLVPRLHVPAYQFANEILDAGKLPVFHGVVFHAPIVRHGYEIRFGFRQTATPPRKFHSIFWFNPSIPSFNYFLLSSIPSFSRRFPFFWFRELQGFNAVFFRGSHLFSPRRCCDTVGKSYI